MTFEEAQQFIEKHDSEYLEDGKEFIKGLMIIDKYVDEWRYNVVAEHDIIYLPGEVEKMTDEDILQLHRYGFHLDSAGDCWAYFT